MLFKWHWLNALPAATSIVLCGPSRRSDAKSTAYDTDRVDPLVVSGRYTLSDDDIARTLERLGALAGTGRVADAAARAFRARVARLEAEYSGRTPVRVFYEVWGRPIVTVNGAQLISKAIRLCGGENVFADLPQIAPEIDREAVLRANPQVIVASGPDAKRPAWLEAAREYVKEQPRIKAVLYFNGNSEARANAQRALHPSETGRAASPEWLADPYFNARRRPVTEPG